MFSWDCSLSLLVLTGLLPLSVHTLAFEKAPHQAPLHANANEGPPIAPPIDNPISATCRGYDFPHVLCVRRYGSVIRGDFVRKVRNVIGDTDTYSSTSMPEDPSFHHVANATFLIFNEERGREILGKAPALDFMFSLSDDAHEAPVYVPLTNELYLSRLHHHFLPQLVVNLNNDPPTISEKIADPPIYAATGARYRNGLIYYATIGGHEALWNYSFRPSVVTLNVTSGKSETLLNNYYGYYFNGIDDLDLDDAGNIWFTDDSYGRPCHVNTEAPQINTAVYRFDPVSGFVTIVEDSLHEPNGIAFSPDGKTLYLSDTSAGVSVIDPDVEHVPDIRYNETNKRTIYAYDLNEARTALINRRSIYLAIDYVPDGIKVSREGYIVTATGHGVDVLTPDGVLLVRVQTNFTAINIAWTGKWSEDLWVVGHGGVARIKWGLRGPIIL